MEPAFEKRRSQGNERSCTRDHSDSFVVCASERGAYGSYFPTVSNSARGEDHCLVRRARSHQLRFSLHRHKSQCNAHSSCYSQGVPLDYEKPGFRMTKYKKVAV